MMLSYRASYLEARHCVVWQIYTTAHMSGLKSIGARKNQKPRVSLLAMLASRLYKLRHDPEPEFCPIAITIRENSTPAVGKFVRRSTRYYALSVRTHKGKRSSARNDNRGGPERVFWACVL